MNSYPSQNLMTSSTEANKGSNLPTYWFHSYFHVPRTTTTTTGIDLSQLPQPNPCQDTSTTAIVPPQAHLFLHPAPTRESSSTNKSPSKALKPKPQRKKRSAQKKTLSIPETKREKKNPDINVDISRFDVSGVPPPVCSCTGVPKVCYKWGMGGWQSSCCTINISTYPLPMSTTRPGVRVAGRKMSHGAYVKLLFRLAGEGFEFTQPVDLKNHWARHGTNKFVTIK